jgi:adenosylcobinamide-GDP ribazoletransferase
MASFRLALRFLTVLPVPAPEMKPGALGRAAIWFPWIGLLLGGALALCYSVCSIFFPPLLTAALLVAVWAALTGGLHLDGVADCGDGFFASAPAERRLEIMRDPRVGAFGAVSLILLLLIKIIALASLPDRATAYGALLTAPTLARWMMLWMARQPAARAGGLGADFAQSLSLGALLAAALLPLASIVIFSGHAILAVCCAGVATLCVILLARNRLGGVTGDVLGFSVELAEVAALLAFAATV